MALQSANIVYISYNDGPEYTTFDAFTSKVVKTEANSYNYIFNEPQSNGYSTFDAFTPKNVHKEANSYNYIFNEPQSNGYSTFDAFTPKNVKIVTAAVTSISYNPPVISWG